MGEFVMPSLGSQMIEAKLIQWFVKPGDTVKRGDIIGEIDTEKGLIDIEVFEEGTITELVAKEGEVITVGSVMAVIDGRKGEMVQPPEEELNVKKDGEKKHPSKKPEQELRVRNVKASPLARRVAADLNVELKKVAGTGPGGTIHRKDVEAFAKERNADTASRQELEIARRVSASEPVSMRQAIATAMSRSNRDIPHYYLEMQIDMKQSLDWLEETNRKRTLTERLMVPALLIKAVGNALSEVPELNGFWTDETMHIEEGIHVGFAISLRRGGLVIPALLNADTKDLEQIQEEFVSMVNRAREGHLRSREVSSATATITSLGERGADKVYGVIYPPQVALIGFGKIMQRPWVIDDAIGIRPIFNVVLAGDHRATDGHTGSRFLEILNNQLQQPGNL